MGAPRIRRLSSLLAGVALLVAGCGGGSSPSGPTAGSPTATRVTIDADPSGALRWVQPRAEAKAGRVRVTLRNRSAVAHDLHVSGRGVDAGTPTIQEGSATVAVALDPGTYRYVCEVPGHDSMSGTLTVK